MKPSLPQTKPFDSGGISLEPRRDLVGSLFLPTLFMGTVGAAYWACVRMAGQGCGWTNGLIWGLAWYFLGAVSGERERRAYGSGWVVLALVVGMYFGGMHGYGQFHSWVQGKFHLDSSVDDATAISPWVGCWWLWLCGLGWGGVAGIFLAWTGSARAVRGREWVLRILVSSGMAWAFRAFAAARPDLVMPLYDRVDYADLESCPSCERTVQTLVESMMWLGFYFGGVVVETLRRDWRNVKLIATMGIGFGLAFIGFEWFHTLHGLTEIRLSWWKYWEASVGLLGGMTLGLCFHLYNQPSPANVLAPEDRRMVPRFVRAEYLLGIWLPLLVSLYMVLPHEVNRLLRFFPPGKDSPLAESLHHFLLGILMLVGSYVLWRNLRTPRDRLPEHGFKHPGWLFVIPYALMFFAHYLPQFFARKDQLALGILLTIHGLNFTLGLCCYWWIQVRSSQLHPATSANPKTTAL